MDKETRNRIQRATQSARALLEHEYAEQLEGLFDVRLDGTIAAEPGEHLDDAQRVLRAKLITAIEHQRTGGMTNADGVAAYLREAAFTTLNRFVALKMLEARELVQECISRGDQSAGFKEFSGLAPGLVQIPDQGYRIYIESLFDEIGREVKVLFDRRDPASLLWPRRQALQELLEILNDSELAEVQDPTHSISTPAPQTPNSKPRTPNSETWSQDETIGWVYQYFNSDAERKRARYNDDGKPKTPQNSYELAVRNQFFTPRYVVQFLTDNTLGRVWYEMRQGETRLRELDYLVRRPKEVFLAEGDPLPEEHTDQVESQDGSAAQPFPIRFRAKTDPRDLKILDPACGSGHFLLYAFDLLLTIYEEAWADEISPVCETTGRTLRDDYPEIETLRAAVPGLVLRHNLHGIDIDVRCAQIAALALWMRAQRAYKALDVGREVRPAIRKTNIVVAEPMPGEIELRREFIATQDPKLGQLFERVFDRMELAGEAGSLLRIEDEICNAVQEIHDEQHWRTAEESLVRVLRAYAEHAMNGRAFQRRLFVEDAVRGLGFIDVCCQRYDTILMNPPFGTFSLGVRDWVKSAYPRTKNDIYAAFVERGIELLEKRSFLGAITSRTGFFLSSFQKWREEILLKEAPPVVVADLGYGVMDDAMVATAAYCLEVAA